MLASLHRDLQMPRRAQIPSGCSEAATARRSVVPGSSFADIMMRLAITFVVETARSRRPLLSLAAVVDDVQGTVYGHPGRVQEEAAQSCNVLVLSREWVGLPISVPKVR